MKKYVEYMDSVSVSDTLHQRLLALESYQKRPAWMKYGAMAAALLLVAGLGAWGIRQGMHTGYDTPLYFTIDANAEPGIPDVDIPEITDIGEPAQPDIAPVEPGDAVEPGMKTIGGYEVRGADSGPDTTVAYYGLPYIEYGDTGGVEVCLDWDVPMGAVKKDLTQEEIVALMGGADAVSDHLDWGMYELSGWAAWYEDGSFWGAYIDGVLVYYGGPGNQFEFAVTANQLPPTCFGYPNSVTQEIRGLTVTADKCDREVNRDSYTWNICERRVSFMKDNCGYRFEMSSASAEAAEEMVSRLVARIADKGLALDTLTSDGAELAHPWEDPNYAEPDFSVGEPNWEDGTEYD